MPRGLLDRELANPSNQSPFISQTKSSQSDSIPPRDAPRFDNNVELAGVGQRRVPVISYAQAGMMTEAIDPYDLGQGFDQLMTDIDVSDSAFALEITGVSMLPDFPEGDRVIIDPHIQPQPGDFVVAKNGNEEVTFKKYRPRGTNARGAMIFELVPLNDDFPTLNSDRDEMHIVGVMVEHRKYRRR
ncbi:S24 family peptidase [Pararobbsia silviterrae]|uniref:S24 family peptidase n=2 Tax=Pararobbsia silviterrae TaxID=1792498 RepID=A0A494XGH9_9BURK|nr:S24 family peptidase [Pararobbsia silviterrae]